LGRGKNSLRILNLEFIRN